ncbi:Calx-beta domain-containing protein [Reyranella sp.]|uniref:Calx-beta domain-containing protein n=1 Tax=Reyranella sp. TaxID=1929291 RepID=UPI0037833723
MTSNVIFIDWRVEDPQSIVAGLPAGSTWYILSPGEDGIGQIRRIVARYSNLDSIQIVSHGREGALLLGSSVVDAASLTAEASALAEIGGSLSETGDLLLYGCEVGQGEIGRAFVDVLANLIGADVAASADRTGAAALGGNWTLEVASGAIEALAIDGGGYAQLLGPAVVAIAPTIAFKAEGFFGTSTFTFTVTRGIDFSAAQTVDWQVSGGGPNAATAEDFVGGVFPSGTLNFAINQTSATITVNVQGGVAAEPTEFFSVTLLNPSPDLSINTATAYGTILDGGGVVYRASINPQAVEGNDDSFDPALSPGGTLAAFASRADNLVSGDGNDASDIFVKDLTTGLVQRITMGFLGDEANNSSFSPVFSPAGGKIAFVSQASNLVVGDGNFTTDIFVWSNGTITRVSTDALGNESNGFSDSPSFSANGTKIVFVSNANNLVADDTNGTEDIFVKDLTTGAIQRVNTTVLGDEAAGDGEGGGYSSEPIFSPDASRVAFVSVADNLVAGDTNDVADVFVKTLSGGAIVRVSVNASGVQANGDSSGPVFSPNGRVAFTSEATNLIAGDTNGVADIFIKSLDGSITRISTDATGSQANGASWGAVFSPDGARIFFASVASNLVAGDTNGVADIFVKDLFTGQIARVSTNSSNVETSGGNGSSEFVLSADGNRLAFYSAATNLVNGGDNGSSDIYVRSVSTVVITATDAIKAEGQSGTTLFTFTVTRSGDITQEQSLDWDVVGTGADAADFGGNWPSGFVHFAPTETSKTISISVSGDTSLELDEEFTVTLSAPSPGLFIMAPSATGTIQNDDTPIVSITPLSAVHPEGDGGTTAFTFTVSIDQSIANFESVEWAVVDAGGHPADASDFFGGTLPSGLVTFSYYDTSATITIQVAGDVAAEFNEDFSVVLSNPTPGLVLGTATATGTIQNDDAVTVSIAPASAVKPEGNTGFTSFTFTVTLNQAAEADQTVHWAVITGSGGHAATGADFGSLLPMGTVTFVAGDTTETVTIAVAGDSTVEFDEEFTVTLSSPSSGLVLGTATATGTIQNDDVSTVSIAPASAVKPEGNSGTTPFTFTVSLDRAGVVSQTVNWAVTGPGGHAASGADFGGSLPIGTVTFVAGDTTETVTIAVAGDSTVEFDEEFTVTLSSPSSGLVLGTATASGTIQNDDVSTVSIAPLAAIKAEGDSGTTSFTFTVSLDRAGVVSQTVNWAVTGSGAHAADAADFGGALPIGSVTFAAGETSKVVTVLVSGDTTIEFDEELTVTLSGASSGLALGTATASGTIQTDDRATASIAAQSAVKAEGNTGNTAFTFTVTLDRAMLVDQTVDWTVAGSGAHAANAADFGGSLPSGSVSFAAGETSKTISVFVAGDSAIEFNEDFAVTLSNASSGLILGNSSASGTIQNDDVSTVSIAPLSANKSEGNSGTTSFTFTVSLDQAGVGSQTVNWAAAGSGAHAANAADFGGSLPSGSVTFLAGDTSRTVTVSAAADTVVEFDEEFLVTLSGASSGLALGTAAAGGTIQNDDHSIVSIAALSAIKPEGNSGSTSFTFTVSLDQAAVTGQTVDWAVTGSGAHSASSADFGGALPSGSVSFAAGETSKTVTVAVSGDPAVEFDEDFTIALSNVSSGLILGTSSASGTIQNDDRSAVSITALTEGVLEGDAGTAPYTFRITLDQASVTSQSIEWTVIGTGTHPADATDFGGAFPSGAVTFAPGETSKTVTLEVSGDTALEFGEAFTVALAHPSSGLLLAPASSITGTINNDDGLIVSIADLSAVKEEGNDGQALFTFTVRLNHLLEIDGPTIDWAVTGSVDHPADATDFGGILPSGTVTFGPNQQVVIVRVFVSGDTLVEFDETFTVTLSNPADGLFLGVETASGVIRNDDVAVVSIAAASAAKAEGDGGGTTAFTFTVSLGQASVTAQSVDWSVAGIGAHAASAADFAGALPSGSVTFAAGETSKTVTVQVAADGAVELDEGFSVTLANASSGLVLGTTSAAGTIQNDDKPVASIAAVSANRPEGDSGTASFTFTVSLDQAGLASQTLDWAVVGSGPHGANAADFGGSLPGGSLTFGVGETSKVVTVTVSGDSAVEFDEIFVVTLSNASSGLALGTTSASGTIVNDDRSVVSIAPLSAVKPEGGSVSTSFTFTLSLDQAGATEQSVLWSVVGTGPHAADGTDFVGGLPSGMVTFAAGEISTTVTIDVAGDGAVEFDEEFDVTLSTASAGLAIGVSAATGTIQNDDKAAVSIAVLTADKAESNSGSTAFTFVVSLDQAAVTAETVDWSVSGSGAHPASPLDFDGVLPSGSVIFGAGETSKIVTVLISGDTAVELDEGFAVSLSNASAGLVMGTATAIGTIRNDDGSVASIAALSAEKPEGDSGTTLFTFTVRLDQAALADQTIAWSVTGSGTHAANAADFGSTLPSGAITFAAGEVSKTVTVAVTGDPTVEFDEEFTVTLASPSAGILLGTTSAHGIIQDDDKPAVSVAALAATQAEGNAGTTGFTFTLTLNQPAVASQTVVWTVTGSGTHPADAADFGGSLPSGVVTFAPGETSEVVSVAVSGDLAPELDEGFSLALSNPSAGLALGISSASGTVVNDDGSALTIAPLAAVRAEGGSGSTPLTFVLSLDTANTSATTVDWSVSGSGAHAADATDFGGTTPAGTVTFAAGETSKVLTVLVSGDSSVEFDEGFKVTLSNASGNVDVITATASGTILNDDTSTVSIAAQSAAKAEGNSGTTAFAFAVSLDQAGTATQTVDWSVAGSGAHAANAADFGGALPFGTVTFAAGETSKTVTLLVSGDAAPEFDESFDVILANASAGLAMGTTSASATIQNDDLSISIAALSASRPEGNAGTTPFTFLVTLTGDTSAGQSVDYAVSFSGGDPAVSSDFAGNAFAGGTVSFAPGETVKTILVDVAGDVVKEADETFSVTLSNPSPGVAIGTASATGTIRNDDVLPSLPPEAHDDAYIDFPGQALHIGAASGVLFNDGSTVPLTASLLTGPAHGTLSLAADGGFDYTPDAGFFGIDSFSYRAAGVGSSSDEHALIYVTPLTADATLDLARLTAEEQVAATYTAFFGRGADKGGFGFWVHEFAVGAPSQGAATLFGNIASSFAVSDEAQSLYPFLLNPFGASDSQIGSFLDTVYNNLFNRSVDIGGLSYWTSQIRDTLSSGKFVGSVLTDIMSGAQNTTQFQDITTLMGKVAVSLGYVHEQQRFNVPWTAADDGADAAALLHAVTADPQTVLVGILQAYDLSFAALARSDGFGGSPGGVA